MGSNRYAWRCAKKSAFPWTSCSADIDANYRNRRDGLAHTGGTAALGEVFLMEGENDRLLEPVVSKNSIDGIL